MFTWLMQNIGTIIVLAVLITVVTLIVRKMVKDKKSGKGSCSCGAGCGNCPMSGSCHK